MWLGLEGVALRSMDDFSKTRRTLGWALTGVVAALLAGCTKVAPPAAPPQAMPVQVQPVTLTGVPSTDTYVSTIKSRRSATLAPQVDGRLTKILVKSGDQVKAGQMLMEIDPLKQVATVESQQGTEQQLRAVFEYNQTDVERQKKLFEQGIISKQAYDQAVQSFQNAKGALDSAAALTHTQKEQLAYYEVRAPFAGTVGDIPVHVGDYVSPSSPNPVTLTTVDEIKELEAYIYLPAERAGQVKMGLPVDLLDTDGTVLAHSRINFVSPEVDNGLQGILAKAPIPQSAAKLRNQQMVNARITWSTDQKPTVPVLAVTRVGGQSFVYVAAPQGAGFAAHQVAVTLGEPVGNVYPVLAGLGRGDRVILSGIQFLQEGVPVQPLGPAPAPTAGN
jgi:RND family efflux transporter MFP subunit